MAQVVALDIGGTKVAGGLVNEAGRLTDGVEIATRATGSAEELFGDVAALARGLLEAGRPGDVEAIGVGCGGPMTAEGISPVNIPAWRDFPLQQRLTAEFGVDVIVDNDAKAFAVGEGWIGAARGVENFLGMVVSTGVGGGIVLDGRLLHGQEANAGHIGHIVVVPDGEPCTCGARGCVEAEASGLAIARKAAHRCAAGYVGDGPLLDTWVRVSAQPHSEGGSLTTVSGMTAPLVVDAVRAGDSWAEEILGEAGRAAGRGIATVASLLDLRLAVVGGGVAQAGELLFGPLRDEARRDACISHARGLEIVPAALRRHAGVIGAAALVLAAEAARRP